MNLNANETDGIDADVSTTGVNVFIATGDVGDDVLSAVGGKGTGEVLPFPIQLYGLAGNDRLVGGSAADFLRDTGGIDNDTDLLRGHGGADYLDALDHDTLDSLFAGPGIDTCNADVGDLLDGC